MQNLKLKILSAILLLCGAFVGFAEKASAVVYLSPLPGNDNQNQINAALSSNSSREDGILTVHLTGGEIPYIVNGKIIINSDTILEGDDNTVIKLADNLRWREKENWQGLIEGASESLTNITIRNFEIDINKVGENGSCEDGYSNIMVFKGCAGLEINNMYLHGNGNDVLKATNCSNIKYHNNIIKNQGNLAANISISSGVQIYNNNVTVDCQSGFRVFDSSGIEIYGNILNGASKGVRGIEVGSGNTEVVTVSGNKIYNFSAYGISVLGSGTANMLLHHNIIYNCQGGITINKSASGDSYKSIEIGFNTIDSNNGPAMDINSDNVIANSNIFSNNQGVKGSFVSEGNCFSNNSGATKNDITVDNPGFASPSSHDYHLKSMAGRWSGVDWVVDDIDSACIDQGTGKVVNEFYPNGCKPNPGRYGNTEEASISGAKSPNVILEIPKMNSYANHEEIPECYDEILKNNMNLQKENDSVFRCSQNQICAAANNIQSNIEFFARIIVLFGILIILCSSLVRIFAEDNIKLQYYVNLLTKYSIAAFCIFFLGWVITKIIMLVAV